MRVVKVLGPTAFALAFVGVCFAAGDSPMGGGSMPSMREMSPQDIARNAYNDGLRAVKQARKYEEDVAEATREDKKAKAAAKARKQYDKARGLFAAAVSKQGTMHEAWNYIGYTSRKLGEHDKALSAYNEALRLKPDYNQAIEYRGVAYLYLNRTDDAKAAYMTLFRSDRALATQLMDEMQAWLNTRRADADVAPAQLDAFESWLKERASVAAQTASLAIDAPVSAWQ